MTKLKVNTANRQTAAPVRPITPSMAENPFPFLLRFFPRFCPAAARVRLALPDGPLLLPVSGLRFPEDCLLCMSDPVPTLFCAAAFLCTFPFFCALSFFCALPFLRTGASVNSCVSSKSSSLISQPSSKARCKSSGPFDISSRSLSVIYFSRFPFQTTFSPA